MLLITLTTLYLMLLNRKHANTRIALGKNGVVVDRSMMNALERSENEPTGDEGDKAFDDMTDLQNEDFVFVY